MDPYATHLPMLVKAVMLTEGPVLELGVGYGSTYVLHEMCRGRRRLVSLETDARWMGLFGWMESKDHELRSGGSYEEFAELVEWTPWSVAFVDHAPVERRVHELRRLVRARYVVIHDAVEDVAKDGYGYLQVVPLFKYKVFYGRLEPATMVLSNVDDLREFKEGAA